MAFGKPPDKKVMKLNPVTADNLWKAYVRSEEVTAEAWQSKWGWILIEYGKLQKEMADATKNSVTLPPPLETIEEHRTTKPVPVSETNKIGWLSSRPEFKLEKYGPDVYKGMPFLSLSD